MTMQTYATYLKRKEEIKKAAKRRLLVNFAFTVGFVVAAVVVRVFITGL